MTSQPNAQGAEGFVEHDSLPLDLKAIGQVVVRRRWPMLSAFLLVLAGVVLFTFRQQKIYSSTCTVIIDLAAPKVLDGQVQEVVDSGTGGFWFGREYYETQYKVISSRAVASLVVEKLHLANDLHFLGLDRIEDLALREKRRLQADPIAIVQLLLHVEPVKESRMVQLRVEHPDPQLAAAIANAFAEAYIAEMISVKLSTTQTAYDWLEKQLVDLESKLDLSTRALYMFKKEKDIVSTSFEDKQSMVSQRLVALNDALTKAQIQRAQMQARSEAVRTLRTNPGNPPPSQDAIAQISNQRVVQDLKLKVLDISNECADLKQRYLERHPKLTSCMERLALAQDGLKHEVETGFSVLEREYTEAIQTERNLAELYGHAKAEAFKVNQYEEEYQRFKRTLDNNQRLYDVVLKRLKDAGLSGLMRMSNVRILDRARPPVAPVRPNWIINLLLAVLMGLVLSVVSGLAFEYLDSTINSQEQVEQRLGLTFLGILPKMRPKTAGALVELSVHRNPKSAVAECCRSVWTNLIFMSPDKPLKTILITSGGPEEGKTTAAFSLAAIMADSGNRVLLLDADMRRPRTHRVLGVPNDVGLSSVIVGAAKIEEAIKTTEVPRLSIMVCGPVPPNPTELLHTQAFGNLLRSLEERFDRIVIDSPPVAMVADAAVISTQVAGTVLVIKAGRTSRELGLRSIRALRNVNATIFGAILNDLDLEDRNYGYYYYYNHYGQYYGPAQDEATS